MCLTYSNVRIHPLILQIPLFSKIKQYIPFYSSFFRNSFAKNSFIHFSLPSCSKFMLAQKPWTSRSILGPISIILILLILTELFKPTSIETHGFTYCYKITSPPTIEGSKRRPGFVTIICSVYRPGVSFMVSPASAASIALAIVKKVLGSFPSGTESSTVKMFEVVL